MQPKPPFYSKALESWKKLTNKQKTFLGGGAAAVLLLIFLIVQIQKAGAYVNLYEVPLSPNDIQNVTQALSQMGVPYTISQNNNIKVPPSQKVQALATLTQHGLPHQPFIQMPAASTGETSEQFSVDKRLYLEKELTAVLRQFHGIADANVNLVIPSQTDNFFSNHKQQAKAAVVLKLMPGEQFHLHEAKAIQNLVAASVPYLSPKNVQITDTHGRLLSHMLKNYQNENMPDNMLKIKEAYEKQYESQIRQILNPVLGRGKYALAVNVRLNWNQSEARSQKVGTGLNTKGSLPLEVEKTTEKFNNKKSGSQGGVQQLGFQPYGGAAQHGTRYGKSMVLQKNAIDQTNQRTIYTPGQVTRITAAVLADQSLSPSSVETLTASIKNAIGMDEARGDRVSFGTLPFKSHAIAQMSSQMDQGGLFRQNAPSPISGEEVMRILAGLLCVGLILGIMFFLRQQKVQAQKGQLVLTPGPAETVSDISDLLTEKTGKITSASTSSKPAQANQTEKLEQLAKEKPTKVAELLKTTWLSEK
jgi:flagellar M-ring protein FliF